MDAQSLAGEISFRKTTTVTLHVLTSHHHHLQIPREPTIARQLWERSLFIAPGHTDTLVNYATLLIENNQPRIAYDMLATALKVDPDKV